MLCILAIFVEVFVLSAEEPRIDNPLTRRSATGRDLEGELPKLRAALKK